MNITRGSRAVPGIGAVLAALLLLAGCSGPGGSGAGSGEGSGDAGASRQSLLPAAEGKTQYPLTLESEYGETVLEKRPERIAAIVPNGIDTELLLSLGVTPVLSSSMIDEGGYLAAHGAAELDTYEFVRGEDVPMEAVAAADPDLIVTVGWTPGFGEVKDIYDRLARIAPVVTSPASDQRMIPWQDSIRILGETLDLGDAAEAVIAEHDELFAGIRSEHPEFGGQTATWAIYYGPSNGLQYFSQHDSAPELFLSDLGFAPNPNAAEFARDTTVSDELLSKIDADVLLLGRSEATSAEEMERQVTGTELFRNLEAVRAGKYIQLPPKTDDGGDLLWAITSGGPIGNAWAAERLVPVIAEAL
ncbi:ABC transporter substrate-binding protein [Leucobacter massiliensis]|uniref:ABC transporter substrate-binding protein n=1 Tax=Leucobacter massiliensis TaxID=1686285 RepID=A0A2S9QKM1_9MICO|nr:ABC transporter substrate-binding protein [Leucobacter massiliensis]PRI10137.1 ABC transporter substrate-binding protein [Leucobacter massiliensis]